MRIGRAEVAAHRDGISLDGHMLEALKLAGLLSRGQMLDPESSAFAQSLDMMRGLAQTSRAFAWLCTPGDSRREQLDAGAAWLRFTLKAAGQGLSVHPWSHSLQEFPEMGPLHEEIRGLIGDGDRVQMLARLGYAARPTPSPRRGLGAHLVREE
jgi:hypothetical protein